MHKNFVRIAVELAGGDTAVANALKVSNPTVFRWKKNGRVPRLALARLLSKISGVPVIDLRPVRVLRLGVF